MIRELLRPESVQEALALKAQYGNRAVYLAGGARLNATPTKTTRDVAISLKELGLKDVSKTSRGWEIGALTSLQQLVDHPALPAGLQEAAGLVFSRNLRNQITLGGEIAANLRACLVVPALLAMDARVELAEGQTMTVEAWQQQPEGLILRIIVPESLDFCQTVQVQKSCASQPIISAALAVSPDHSQFGLALAGVAERPVRLHDVEALLGESINHLSQEQLEQAVTGAVFPVSDALGSSDYKRHLSGVLVSQLVAEFKGREH